MNGSIFITSASASTYLAESIAKQLSAQILPIIRDSFADGEHYLRLDIKDAKELLHATTIHVGATTTDATLLEMHRIGATLAALGTQRRIFIIPFLGYSTMEKAKLPGEVVAAKTNATLLSSIPHTNDGNTFLFLDLHEPSLIHYFEGDNTHLEVSARELLASAIANLRLSEYVLGSADLGMPGQIEFLATALKVPVALISKARKFSNTSVVACVGDVTGKDVVIYDDMIRSGSSIMQAAEAYKDAGAKDIYVATTHLALTSADIIYKLESSSIQRIIATNSHPMSTTKEVQQSPLFDVRDCTALFVDPLKPYAR